MHLQEVRVLPVKPLDPNPGHKRGRAKRGCGTLPYSPNIAGKEQLLKDLAALDEALSKKPLKPPARRAKP